MKVALLTPRFVSKGVIELAESIRKSELGLHAVISFDAPGPARTRLSRLASSWHLRSRQPREEVLNRYRTDEKPRSPNTDDSIVAYARSAAISSWRSPAMNDEAMVNAVQESSSSVVLSVGAGIVGKKLLNLPDTVFVNAHAGRLPDLPGRDTAEWAVYLNQPIYGSVHRMASRVDIGDLLVVRPLDLGRPGTVLELHDAAWASAWGLVVDALLGLAGGRYSFVPQDLGRRRHMYYRMHPELLRVVSRRLCDGTFFDIQERAVDEFRRAVRSRA